MESLDINSSDFEGLDDVNGDDIFAPNANIGQRVAAKIIANQAIDRPLSKKNARSVKFARGAPKTREAQQSVTVIWDAFCATVKHDPKTCPSGELILRFIDTRARSTVPGIRGKTAPSLSVVRGFWRRLIDLLIFRHEDIRQHYTPYWVNRIGMHLDQLATKKDLVRGLWQKRQWLGFKVILRMAQIWIDRAIDEGCISWDRTLLKLLGVVLQSACSSRSGDIARSTLYKGLECLCWKHLQLTIKDPDQPLSVQNLTLQVTLAYTKGHKNILNDDTDIFIEPLEHPGQSVVCVIKLLLIIALRFGRVNHTSLEDLLAEASDRFYKSVVWKYPEAPVLCQIARGTSTLAFDKPAHQSQILHAVQEMALTAGLLAPVDTRSIRNGSIRDAAYLKKSINGVSDRVTAFVANHTTKALDKGTNQNYIGPLQQPIFNMRAEDPFENRLAPKFSDTPFSKDTKYSTLQIDSYMDQHGMDKTNLLERAKAGKHMKQAATQAWMEEQKNATVTEPAPTKPKKQALRQQTTSEINVVKPPAKKVNTATGSEKSTKSSLSVSARHTIPEDMQNIDPRLLFDDMQDLEVNEEELGYICDMIQPVISNDPVTGPTDQGSEEDVDDESIEQALADEVLQIDMANSVGPAETEAPSLLTGNAFVDKFAAINVYRLKRSFDSNDPNIVAKYIPTGNSREPPTAYLYYCSKCPYGSRWQNVVESHEVTCGGDDHNDEDASLVKTTSTFDCHYADCGKPYTKVTSLQSHISTIHEFKPKTCVRCPESSSVIYHTHLELQKHTKNAHDGLEQPTVCPQSAECGKTEAYTNKTAFKLHMRSVHKKTPQQIEKLVPRKKTVRSSKKKAAMMSDGEEDDATPSQPKKSRGVKKSSKKSTPLFVDSDDDGENDSLADPFATPTTKRKRNAKSSDSGTTGPSTKRARK
ncbi:unnamed protein product [Zymoseptoria tritici ST99CH_1E4]|uniref:C2H2-type domain-containing protein n=1 Tax=Zymoseptoria tritici ST99CH_1E4 TaxID=1276532 RepID=A0A2H1GP32_ZYMTR|nr:unnamed protein product [Zymoseptoria tritici ST99CH_1E4]